MLGALPFLSQFDQIALTDPKGILDIGTGIFGLILFGVSLYAWYLRRQISLAIVSFAFVMFFARTMLGVFLSSVPGEDIISDALEFVALTLFFVAIVVRPRRNIGKAEP